MRTAAELFAEHGYDATGIADLLARTGISRGAFYYHIDSKETLLFEISRDQVEYMNAVAAEIVAGTGSAAEKVRLMARALIRNISEHRAEWTVFFREFSALTGARREQILLARDQYEQYWREVLEDGAKSGEFIAVTPLHVKGILGMLNYTYLWINPQGALGPEDLADTFVDLLLYGLQAQVRG